MTTNDKPKLSENQKERPLKVRDLDWLIGAVATGMKPTIEKLNRRITELEGARQVKYTGVWSEGKAYGEASLCTDRGGLWYARRATAMRPGTSDDWQLTCKTRGK